MPPLIRGFLAGVLLVILVSVAMAVDAQQVPREPTKPAPVTGTPGLRPPTYSAPARAPRERSAPAPDVQAERTRQERERFEERERREQQERFEQQRRLQELQMERERQQRRQMKEAAPPPKPTPITGTPGAKPSE